MCCIFVFRKKMCVGKIFYHMNCMCLIIKMTILNEMEFYNKSNHFMWCAATHTKRKSKSKMCNKECNSFSLFFSIRNQMKERTKKKKKINLTRQQFKVIFRIREWATEKFSSIWNQFRGFLVFTLCRIHRIKM